MIKTASRLLIITTVLPLSLVGTPGMAQVADTCQTAVAAQTGVTISGDLNKNNSTSAIPAECVGETAGGADAFYTLSMTSGFRYDIRVQPASTLDIAAAVWDDCTLTANPCIAGSDAVGMSGVETITVEPLQNTSVVIQVVGVDAVTGATTSKSKFSMKITETQIPGDTGPGDQGIAQDVLTGTDEGQADIPVTPDSSIIDDTVITADTGRADVGLPVDSAIQDIAVPADITVGQDLAGHDDDDPDGCGQGRTPSPAALILLLAGIVLLRRRARSA